jgi:hypothetical protein
MPSRYRMIVVSATRCRFNKECTVVTHRIVQVKKRGGRHSLSSLFYADNCQYGIGEKKVEIRLAVDPKLPGIGSSLSLKSAKCFDGGLFRVICSVS